MSRDTTLVEVIGRYSNLSEQGERIRDLLEIVPSRPSEVNPETKKQVHRQLRPPEIAELVAGYQAGATVYELAKVFRIHRDTVSKVLERKGIPRRNRPLTPEQIAWAVDLYGRGHSLVQVGSQLGCDPSTIWRLFRNAGIKMRDLHGRDRHP